MVALYTKQLPNENDQIEIYSELLFRLSSVKVWDVKAGRIADDNLLDVANRSKQKCIELAIRHSLNVDAIMSRLMEKCQNGQVGEIQSRKKFSELEIELDAYTSLRIVSEDGLNFFFCFQNCFDFFLTYFIPTFGILNRSSKNQLYEMGYFTISFRF